MTLTRRIAQLERQQPMLPVNDGLSLADVAAIRRKLLEYLGIDPEGLTDAEVKAELRRLCRAWPGGGRSRGTRAVE